ncbi:hypothetical protein RY831_16740 [Noviherbaspirillum sp. CPCC 100848]|uniref:Uncharacterized protein n=1 Tax=Noviherbaspirillum album TaxID=3080276 RepID=A0ABU6JAZ0_9BURK|nr:hypothetical protein [Noviherbaspirillum sp. CPCC 100848]MEC4720814.1 hypothetical protein [Noviherbaspirillum sp. CPCC 100848]
MNASRLLIACAFVFSTAGLASAVIANTAVSEPLPELPAEPAELVVDLQGMAIDISATVRDPIRGERSY